MHRLDLAHDLADAMRSALASAALAAGQIERDAVTPRGRRLAHAVTDAVAELDRLVSEAVALLAREGRAPRSEDLRTVLAELRRRHAGALAARGFEWVDAPEAARIPHGDPALARRASALLLRVGAACVRGGGRIALAATSDGAAWCLGIDVEARTGAADAPQDGIAALRALASRARGALDHEQRGGRAALRLRFPIEAGACPAS